MPPATPASNPFSREGGVREEIGVAVKGTPVGSGSHGERPMCRKCFLLQWLSGGFAAWKNRGARQYLRSVGAESKGNMEFQQKCSPRGFVFLTCGKEHVE